MFVVVYNAIVEYMSDYLGPTINAVKMKVHTDIICYHSGFELSISWSFSVQLFGKLFFELFNKLLIGLFD